MGQWFRSFFESQSLEVLIYSRKTKTNLGEMIKKADIVMLSLPMSQIDKVIRQITPDLRENQLLTDISSLKENVMQTMSDTHSAVLGMHPLFGPSNMAPAGQKIVICKQKTTAKSANNKHIDFLLKTFQNNGLVIIEMAPSEHDRQMAFIQALTHTINIIFAQTLSEQKATLDGRLQTPLFMLQSLAMQRVLQQEPDLIADIQLLNPHFVTLLENFITKAQNLLELNKSRDRTELIKQLKKIHITPQEAAIPLQETNRILQLLEKKSITFTETKKVKHNNSLRAAFLGPEGTYTHQAAANLFKDKNLLSASTIEAVFHLVHDGKVDVGVVPAENSIHGTVRETLDLLSDSSLKAIGSYDLPIHHNLLSQETILDDVDEVISHPQALAQCRNFLSEHLPKAIIISASSTTSALKTPQPHQAFIASAIASQLYFVPILRKDIEDITNNTTRFYVISKHPLSLKGLKDAHTLVFLTIYNRVGILRDILTVFADNGISLSKLESRPSREKLWDYHFFMELDVRQDDPALKNTLEDLEQFCPMIKVLGEV